MYCSFTAGKGADPNAFELFVFLTEQSASHGRLVHREGNSALEVQVVT